MSRFNLATVLGVATDLLEGLLLVATAGVFILFLKTFLSP